jgi:hypothetical protein
VKNATIFFPFEKSTLFFDLYNSGNSVKSTFSFTAIPCKLCKPTLLREKVTAEEGIEAKSIENEEDQKSDENAKVQEEEDKDL